MNPDEKQIVCIVCSIFRQEVESLQAEGKLDFPLRFLDSMLHMKPAKLRLQLTTLIKKELGQGNRILLIYGDCHSHMVDLGEHPDVVRTEGVNCCEILLGSQKYRQLRKEGAFFLLPEWAVRWKEVFQHELGLNKDNARSFMADLHTKLIYLDTGSAPIPEDALQEFPDYCDLSWSVMKVSTEHLLESIRQAVRQFDKAKV
ncbi:MAG: DUF1638 domain-containing protein [Planctomycetes bacterium]|nr:DUF1638 domain-containing protein [Planctomycetota bacterium]